MDMREAAEEYCAVIEAARGSERRVFVEALTLSLSTAVAAAYRIPEIAPTSGDLGASFISHRRWFARMNEIQGVLGEWDNYWTAMSAYRLDREGEPDLSVEEDIVNLSLADALADIWRDLRNGLDALERGAAVDDVLWEWRFTFRTHWGAHAVEALRAIHEQVKR